MSGDADPRSLEARLATLIDEARALGRMADLEAAWRELSRGRIDSTASTDASATHDGHARKSSGDKATRVSADVPMRLGADVPMRFGIVGDSPPMRALFELIAKVAASGVSVLIQGETGTGKELVARALHEHSPRKSKPFLAENCAAVPANLLESELFGHKRGSFTGAVADRAGHFVAADGGTVFLDEIGDMPLAMQSKLLRVLQEGEVRPVGSNKTIKVDVRIVAATNKDLRAMCAAKSFREDLYYRLNVVNLVLPPLRARPGDVPHLVRFFLSRIEAELGKKLTVDPRAMAMLETWRWPGNVRELENVIQRAAVFSNGTITVAELEPSIGAGT